MSDSEEELLRKGIDAMNQSVFEQLELEKVKKGKLKTRGVTDEK